MKKLMIIMAFLLVFLAACQHSNPQPLTVIPNTIRAVRVDYPVLSATTALPDTEEQAFKKAGINLVAVGAGRVDWTYFPWTGHKDNWSEAVRDSGVDFVVRDVARFSKWAQVSAVVDVLSPVYIEQHPEVAAVSWGGKVNSNLVSLTAMTSGDHSQTLLDFIDAVAHKPNIKSVTLIEMFYYVDGFGADDLESFKQDSGAGDWPRLEDGEIDINAPAISQWRAHRIGAFLERAAAIVHAQGKELWLEVKPNPQQMGEQDWTEYVRYLTVADRLLIFGNSIFSPADPGVAALTLQNLESVGQGHLIYEIGLWKDDDSSQPAKKTALTTNEFDHLVKATFGAGVSDFWLTPSYYLNTGFWGILDPYLQPARSQP